MGSTDKIVRDFEGRSVRSFTSQIRKLLELTTTSGRPREEVERGFGLVSQLYAAHEAGK